MEYELGTSNHWPMMIINQILDSTTHIKYTGIDTNLIQPSHASEVPFPRRIPRLVPLMGQEFNLLHRNRLSRRLVYWRCKRFHLQCQVNWAHQHAQAEDQMDPQLFRPGWSTDRKQIRRQRTPFHRTRKWQGSLPMMLSTVLWLGSTQGPSTRPRLVLGLWAGQLAVCLLVMQLLGNMCWKDTCPSEKFLLFHVDFRGFMILNQSRNLSAYIWSWKIQNLMKFLKIFAIEQWVISLFV